MTIRQDITIYQGSTWSYVYTHKDSAGDPVDLSGYSARMAIKQCFDDSAIAYLSTGSDADGGTIALGGALGTVTMSMTAAQSQSLLTDVDVIALIPPEKRRKLYREVVYMYDLELVSGAGVVTRALEGRLIVQREVTG